MDLDALLRQLGHRMGDWPRGAESLDGESADLESAAPARHPGSSHRMRMRLRDALLDPGRRGARAIALAALLAVAATAVWVIVQSPDGGSAPTAGPASAPGLVVAAGTPGLTGSPSLAATPSLTGSPSLAATPGASETAVLVHVAGLVANPGVYTLADGARVADALDAAGGALPGADLSTVNLARRVSDGEQIAIGVPGAANAGTPAQSTSGGAAGTGTGTGTGVGTVNLNTADVTALATLPGIGPVLAQRIVDWRTEHGPFGSVDQLRDVSGIGSATFQRLAPLVRV